MKAKDKAWIKKQIALAEEVQEEFPELEWLEALFVASEILRKK